MKTAKNATRKTAKRPAKAVRKPVTRRKATPKAHLLPKMPQGIARAILGNDLDSSDLPISDIDNTDTKTAVPIDAHGAPGPDDPAFISTERAAVADYTADQAEATQLANALDSNPATDEGEEGDNTDETEEEQDTRPTTADSWPDDTVMADDTIGDD